MKESYPFPWKTAQNAAAEGQDPLVETVQGWKSGKDILDVNFFAYQVTRKTKNLNSTLISLDFKLHKLKKFNFGLSFFRTENLFGLSLEEDYLIFGLQHLPWNFVMGRSLCSNLVPCTLLA